MADLKLDKIALVMLGATDLERSVAFYVEKLGMRSTGQVPGFAFLDGGGVSLGLSEPLAKAAKDLVGSTEVVFGVDDVKSAHRELCERGVRFMHEPRNVDGVSWAADFVDPDGHVLSILGPEGQA